MTQACKYVCFSESNPRLYAFRIQLFGRLESLSPQNILRAQISHLVEEMFMSWHEILKSQSEMVKRLPDHR